MEDIISVESSSTPGDLNSGNSDLPKLETLIHNHPGRINTSFPDSHWQFCKPVLLPLKTFTIEKLEKLQREAEEKLKNLTAAE